MVSREYNLYSLDGLTFFIYIFYFQFLKQGGTAVSQTEAHSNCTNMYTLVSGNKDACSTLEFE